MSLCNVAQRDLLTAHNRLFLRQCILHTARDPALLGLHCNRASLPIAVRQAGGVFQCLRCWRTRNLLREKLMDPSTPVTIRRRLRLISEDTWNRIDLDLLTRAFNAIANISKVIVLHDKSQL